MARPDFKEGKAAMFVAGPAGPDKKAVLRLVADVGFEAVDAGELKARGCSSRSPCCGCSLRSAKGDFAFVMARRQPGKDRTTNGRAIAAQEAE